MASKWQESRQSGPRSQILGVGIRPLMADPLRRFYFLKVRIGQTRARRNEIHGPLWGDPSETPSHFPRSRTSSRQSSILTPSYVKETQHELFQQRLKS